MTGALRFLFLPVSLFTSIFAVACSSLATCHSLLFFAVACWLLAADHWPLGSKR
jgi:hypothetical protein